jgi:hypothetical protein
MNKNFFLAFLFFCLAASLPALGAKEKDGGKTNAADAPAAPAVTVVQVSGTVRLVGSGLFTEIVISGSEAEWYVDNEEASKLKDLQHRKVTVEAEETVREMKFANGLSAGIRRTLRNIKVISVE